MKLKEIENAMKKHFEDVWSDDRWFGGAIVTGSYYTDDVNVNYEVIAYANPIAGIDDEWQVTSVELGMVDYSDNEDEYEYTLVERHGVYSNDIHKFEKVISLISSFLLNI